MTSVINGMQVVPTIDAFCASGRCKMVSDKGELLYADDDHLSIAGSRFQADTALREVLSGIIKNNQK